MNRPLRIGLSANYMHADPERALYRNKTLLYAESRMMGSVARTGALPLLLTPHQLDAALDLCDGVLLTGGADVAPLTYGAAPIEGGRWPGDPVRDQFEIEVLRGATARGLAVLCICRGIQILNAARGGTLLQDIQTQRPRSLVHRDWHRYDELEHTVTLEPGTELSALYDGASEILVNSIHHQALDEVAPGLRVIARAPDGIIEAVDAPGEAGFLLGVQWHPEWLDHDPGQSTRADGRPIFEAFMEAARRGPAR